MTDVVDQIGHRGTALCANGAVVYDLMREEVKEVRGVRRVLAAQVVQLAREHLAAPTFAVELAGGFAREPAYVARWDAQQLVVRPIEEILGADRSERALGALDARDPIIKLLIRDESSPGDAMLAAMGPRLAGIAVPTHSNAADCLLEVSAPGVDKGLALARLADGLGIAAAEVVAFGDMPNDLAMLTWAGRGYAMADAHPDVLAATTRRAGRLEEHGVAAVLESLLGDGLVGSVTTPG
jgi:hydroxymethylpyrimidine pyrophosphatase-like HAD family hydrolase